MNKPVILHLVSHASGELVEMLARNAIAQLSGVQAERRMWNMVRRIGQVPEILAGVAQAPGYVLHSISHTDVRAALEEGCRHLGVPCHYALEPLISRLAEHADVPAHVHASTADAFDEDYYRRIEAMKYALAHDDGLATDDLQDADVILVGVSRATKTPTCMYLASRGIKAANVPLVPGARLPEALVKPGRAMVVALIVDPARLAQVRTARLNALHQDPNTAYTNAEALRQEVRDVKRLCVLHRWPMIDVSQRSIEQTSSQIIEMLRARAGEPV